MTRERRMNLLKTIPGLLVSAFFIWWTYFRRNENGVRPLRMSDFRGLHLVEPVWILGMVFFCAAGYGTRCYRSWLMLRHVRARFYECSRVLMTSLAANNILPLRIGDVMRIFTYAGDLNATPSIVMSTVLLEKLLDIFTLAVLFVITMHFGAGVSPKLQKGAEIGVVLSTVGLLVLVFGAKVLEPMVQRLFAKTKNAKLAKVEHWIVLAIDCIRQVGVVGTLWLVVCSLVAWAFEGFLYISATRLIGLKTDMIGPWQAVAQANLSFLIPSSPGGIGPFELACKDALVRHGATNAAAGIFGLLIHLYLILAITSVGGTMFLIHRVHLSRRQPLLQEIDTLPVELP